jgi:hypothetical protein
MDLHPEIEALLPHIVASETGEIVKPRWFDVVGDGAIRADNILQSELNDELPYLLAPHLARVEQLLPGRDIRIGKLSVRYIASGITVSETDLESIPSLLPNSPDLVPVQIWQRDVVPEFSKQPENTQPPLL